MTLWQVHLSPLSVQFDAQDNDTLQVPFRILAETSSYPNLMVTNGFQESRQPLRCAARALEGNSLILALSAAQGGERVNATSNNEAEYRIPIIQRLQICTGRCVRRQVWASEHLHNLLNSCAEPTTSAVDIYLQRDKAALSLGSYKILMPVVSPIPTLCSGSRVSEFPARHVVTNHDVEVIIWNMQYTFCPSSPLGLNVAPLKVPALDQIFDGISDNFYRTQ